MDPKRNVRPFAPAPLAAKAALGRAPAPPPARRSIQEDLEKLSVDIQQLRIEFERFLSGAVATPPEELRSRVQALFRQLRGRTTHSVAEGFQLGELEARFNTYNERFNRRLREVEEGRPASRAIAPPPRRFDVRRGVVFGPAIDPEAVEALYQELAGAGGGPKFDLGSFQSYIERQVGAIRAKTGCSEVQFRLAEEEGKLKLKARPVPV
jgi:hypothetical protein